MSQPKAASKGWHIGSPLLVAGLAAILPTFVSAQTPPQLKRFSYTEYHMGVDTRIVVYAPDETTAVDAGAAAFSRIAELDTMMSDYRPTSELMQLSGKAGGPPVHVSSELFLVLKRAEEVSRLSDGFFDVTIGPLVQLWRKARKTHVLPSSDEIRKARKLVGWQMIHLDGATQTVKLDRPGMRLDFGAIAKGYADDEAQAVLKKHGITRALIEMGGDIVVTDPPPGTSGWTIRVPNASDKGRAKDMKLANCAISSSGDTVQFVVIGDKKFSHVVDPHTGYALSQGVQATVIAATGLIADPVSTAITLLPEARRHRVLRAFPGTKGYVRILNFNTRDSG